MKESGNDTDIKYIKEKYITQGFDSLTDSEKIRMLISFSENKHNADTIAYDILKNYDNIYNAIDADPFFLKRNCNISESTEVLFKLISAISVIMNLPNKNKIVLNSAENAKKFFNIILNKSRIEKFVVAVVNNNFRIIDYKILFSGVENTVLISNEKIYTFAAEHNADNIFIAHCHPDSSSSPSNEDINTTLKLKKFLDLFDIKLIDHIIVSPYDITSMYELYGTDIFDVHSKYTAETLSLSKN